VRFGSIGGKVTKMRESYDFSKGTRGVHAARYAEGAEILVDGNPQEPTVVVLEPDVSAVFPDAESVNEALRLLIKTAKSAQELQKAS
jgi:hypothetical protein